MLKLLALVLVASGLGACGARPPAREADAARAMPVGTLVDTAGQPVGTTSLVADGPAVLVFYRGHW